MLQEVEQMKIKEEWEQDQNEKKVESSKWEMYVFGMPKTILKRYRNHRQLKMLKMKNERNLSGE